MTVEKPKPKQLLRPITTGANSAMNQSQFLAIIWNLLKARERSRVHGAIGLGFPSHWLKNWRESFKPIIKRSNRNHVITFDSHLKTPLSINVNGNENVTWKKHFANCDYFVIIASPSRPFQGNDGYYNAKVTLQLNFVQKRRRLPCHLIGEGGYKKS